jgi:hypothetical protein
MMKQHLSNPKGVEPYSMAVAGTRETLTPRPTWLPGVQLSAADHDGPDGWYQRAVSVDATDNRLHVMHLPASRLSPSERTAIERLTCQGEPVRTPPTWSVMVKVDNHVVAYTGISYRVIQVGHTQVPVGGLSPVMIAEGFRGRGYAGAVLASAVSFIGIKLWAPFALTLCTPEQAGFYESLGWQISAEPVVVGPPSTAKPMVDCVAVSLASQGSATWPGGSIDLGGGPW